MSEIRRRRERPLRDTYRHRACGASTTITHAEAQIFARFPTFFDVTYCARCRANLPVREFVWSGTLIPVGS